MKPTELGVVFFLSVFGAEWIRVFKLLAKRMAMFLKNWGYSCDIQLGSLIEGTYRKVIIMDTHGLYP